MYKEHKVHRALKVCRVSRDLKVCKEHKVCRVSRDLKVCKEHKALSAETVTSVAQVLIIHMTLV